MSAHSTDEQFLHRALDLAREGIGQASPNPHVGAVIVDAQGNIAGTGTYTYAGVKHAEILALEAAGSRSRGGTLYINLEPHAHQGRTPPCTDALIAAGIRRVVASMPDPNPKVSGLGFEKLRATGVQVDVGQLEEPARRLNESFARYIRHGVPLVTLKSAMTLDGKIAPAPAEVLNRAADTQAEGVFTGHWITGELARAHAHELRHQHDAILVGIGTILADNPLLTDRSGRFRRRPLLRVILDSHLRLPLDSQLIRSAKSGAASTADDVSDVLVFTSVSGAEKDTKKKAGLESHGVRVETLPAAPWDGRPDLAAVLRRLGELEITSVMIEGGSTVNGAALAAGVADRIFLFYAPEILGATAAVPFAPDAAFQKIKANVKSLHRFGEDFAVEGYLRDPYEE
jgi:diaminohydroxyphosphoribosylaminopyrimidine deaminase/5-amino-6-(5-phosphoribosylamino)uracil reductase